MTSPNGSKGYGKATFQEIGEPNSLSFLDAFCSEDGTVDPSSPVGKVILTFDENNGVTTLSTVGEYQDQAEAQKLVSMGMVEGMKDPWSQLENLVNSAR